VRGRRRRREEEEEGREEEEEKEEEKEEEEESSPPHGEDGPTPQVCDVRDGGHCPPESPDMRAWSTAMFGRCGGSLGVLCWGRCLSLCRSLLPLGGTGARKLGSFPFAANVPDATTAILAKANTCVSLRLVGFP